MRLRNLIPVVLTLAVSLDVRAKEKERDVADDLFTGPVPVLRIEIPAEGQEILRKYHQVWRQQRPERVDVRATVREGGQVYSDVAVHLKGSYSFQPFDGKPSLTLNFDKFVPGRRFHGLSKIHLNNSVQDPSGLCEQLARELCKEVGIVCPRATPALVRVDNRDFGVCVLVEGANKRFVQRNFGPAGTKGNLYDGGSGGDITKDLGVLAGDNPKDRSDLKALADAAAEPDPAKRLARLERALDVEEFITFAAVEAILVHWDGYCIGCNNYRLFHDAARDKMVFLPHGMDQLFGTSNSPTLSLTPMFKGIVAKALLSVPEERARYLRRIEELSAKTCTAEALQARVDRLAERLGAAVSERRRAYLDGEVESLKSRIAQRMASVAQQLKTPPRPLKFGADGAVSLAGASWRFRNDNSYIAQGARGTLDGREVMRIVGGGYAGTGTAAAGGSWRTKVFLEEGHYELSGQARTKGVAAAAGNGTTPGVMLRISGETSTEGLTVAKQWQTISYGFDVRGLEDVELVCEFRGPGGLGEFDLDSMRLTRKGSGAKKPVEAGADQ
jgi:hypothetical protein